MYGKNVHVLWTFHSISWTVFFVLSPLDYIEFSRQKVRHARTTCAVDTHHAAIFDRTYQREAVVSAWANEKDTLSGKFRLLIFGFPNRKWSFVMLEKFDQKIEWKTRVLCFRESTPGRLFIWRIVNGFPYHYRQSKMPSLFVIELPVHYSFHFKHLHRFDNGYMLCYDEWDMCYKAKMCLDSEKYFCEAFWCRCW
jgi:hypothetical protein